MKNRLFILLLCCVLFPMVGNAQDWKVLFSANGGFYEDVFELELFSTNPQGHIRYTTNGNKPTAQSSLYIEPLPLDTCLYSKSDIYTIGRLGSSSGYISCVISLHQHQHLVELS